MAKITITTPFNIDLEFRTATVSRRMLAWLIDIVLICVYYYVMLRVVYPLLGMSDGISTAAELFTIVIPVLLYQLLFEMFGNGQTAGKKLAGIKVIDLSGHEPTWGQYLIRWLLCLGNLFVYIIPYLILKAPAALIFFMVLYLPDFLCVVISARSQRIGDMAAGTAVIDSNYVANINETIYLEVEDANYQPMFPGVMRLTDRDINGIRNLLSQQRPGKDTDAYILQVSDKIRMVLSIDSEMEPRDFLQKLLLDYNFYSGKVPGQKTGTANQ